MAPFSVYQEKMSVASVYLAVLLALSLSHLLNDTIQSLIPAVYPILKQSFALDFAKIGMITLTFQIAGALFQPAIGLYTDRHPLPYSAALGMIFTLVGAVSLAFAWSYPVILVSVALVGIGSSIFHPEATRSARYASGGRQGFAQGIFQVGGQVAPRLGRFWTRSSSCLAGKGASLGSPP
jgi:MFS transporter, FSR family, fosmidomycin resistance protein